MDFSLEEAQREVRDLARKILDDLATNDRLKEVEATEAVFDERLWTELARANLLGLAVGEARGGSGMGFFALCTLLEEIGRAVAPVPALPTLVLGALPIQRFGSEEQQARLLPGVVEGEVVLSAGLQEEGNDDPARPTTTARREGERWRLDGAKICVPAAGLARRVLVSGRSGDGQTAVFLVDPEGEGVALERQRLTHREAHFRVVLDGAPVPAEDVLAGPERGAEVMHWLTERATAAYCAVQVGVSERALRMTAEYAAERVQFDRPIGSFQAVHMRAGDAYIDVEAMRLTCWEAAWRLDRELPASDAVAVAKYWAAEGGQRVGYAAQHLHGGIGIDVDYPLHRYYLWAKQIELTLGNASVQLARIGERLAREPAQPAA